MIPDIDTQLAAVIKSLSDNIMPALDPDNPLAAEQIQLCLAALGIVKKHLPDLRAYARRDLAAHIELTEKLQQIIADSNLDISFAQEAVAKSKNMLDCAVSSAVTIDRQAAAMKQVVSDIITIAHGSDIEKTVSLAVIEAEEHIILRSRAWTADMGFEPDPSALPSLDI